MSEITVPPRNAVPQEATWNAESVYPSRQVWQEELKAVSALLPSAAQYQGRLDESPETFAQAMHLLIDTLALRTGRLLMYANMAHEVDNNDQEATRMLGQVGGLVGQTMAAISFLQPELINLGQEKLEGWLQKDASLCFYSHFIEDLFRKQAHVRSPEMEQLLGMLGDPFRCASLTFGALVNADFQFKPGRAQGGGDVQVTESSLYHVLDNPDRQARCTAWESYTDEFLAHKNTLTSLLSTSIKQNVLLSRARHHPSSLDASLFDFNIPTNVFNNLIATFQKNLPIWHRYWALRRKALAVSELQPYDIWAPLTSQQPPSLSFPEAVEMICKGLAPMGPEYVETVRRGCLEERWVDWQPNQGKAAGAFSSGYPGSHPFILMSFSGNVSSLSTLAHELGHSMHSFLSWKTQPYINSDYSLFVAEVASNFHQALVRAYLLDTIPDPAFQVALLEEAMSNFHRYFFIMPTLARFELETHQRVERGEGLTASDMIDLMATLFSEGYGGQMHVDHDRVGINWATFPHLYIDYYVYQYATGISGAHALASRVLGGQPGAVEAYLSFLKSGGSLYPLETLKRAGVDLTTPAPVEAAFKTLEGYVDRLERLILS